MKSHRKPSMLREVTTYLKEAVRFFDLKVGHITPVVFVIILLGYYLAGFTSILKIKGALLYLLDSVLISAFSTIYLFACIKDFKGEEYSLIGCTKKVAGNFIKIMTLVLLYYLIIFAGVLLLIVPGLIAFLMFIFCICYAIDKDKGILESLRLSREITAGRKAEILSIIFAFLLFRFLPAFIPAETGKYMVFTFIISFATTITYFMQLKVIAMMYVDLEYGWNENE